MIVKEGDVFILKDYSYDLDGKFIAKGEVLVCVGKEYPWVSSRALFVTSTGRVTDMWLGEYDKLLFKI